MRVRPATARSDASGVRAFRDAEGLKVLTEGHRDHASKAGPDEPDLYKSDGRAPDSLDEWSASRDEASPVRRAQAASRDGRPCRASAAQLVAPRVDRQDSVWRVGAKDCPRPPAVVQAVVVPRVARGAARVPASSAPSAVAWVRQALAGEASRAASEYWAPDSSAARAAMLWAGTRLESAPAAQLPEDRQRPQAKAAVDP